ncbi:unnamed protein product [Pieris brassicae]|uniref:C2H2-type domain-containing protein n=1 Tax=Pieris brassicae TaxID=7116 RepID=A0A9P0TJM0_PIEBR|nr:unnamed protein product [Pieris brassicae]
MIMLFKGNSSRLEHLIEKIQANKENHDVSTDDIKEALGSVGSAAASSWPSSTPEPSPSPTSTPTSADAADPEAEGDPPFTLGATEHTPYQCQFCDKAFPRLSYLKKHEQQVYVQNGPFGKPVRIDMHRSSEPVHGPHRLTSGPLQRPYISAPLCNATVTAPRSADTRRDRCRLDKANRTVTLHNPYHSSTRFASSCVKSSADVPRKHSFIWKNRKRILLDNRHAIAVTFADINLKARCVPTNVSARSRLS